MIDYWYPFIVGFCKVNFLCYETTKPNWLGWAVIGFGGIVVFFFVLIMIIAVLQDISKGRR